MRDIGGFDPTFDFTTEASGDPDEHSSTLREYHKRLWSKPLPSGDPFELKIIRTDRYFLHHLSSRGEFYLTSDSAITTWTRWRRMRRIREQIPESERKQFLTIAQRIGGKILFPGKMIDGKPTINQERGRYNGPIADRFDLTLECIRLHYLGETSPLAETLIRYRDFFALFENFKGYADFFLLNDLVSDDSLAVKFFMPFADLDASPFPPTPEAYQVYRRNAIRFVEARNRRMAEYVARL